MKDNQFELASALSKIIDVIDSIDKRLMKLEEKTNTCFWCNGEQKDIERIKEEIYEVIKKSWLNMTYFKQGGHNMLKFIKRFYIAYCGRCGKETEHEGTFKCTNCGR